MGVCYFGVCYFTESGSDTTRGNARNEQTETGQGSKSFSANDAERDGRTGTDRNTTDGSAESSNSNTTGVGFDLATVDYISRICCLLESIKLFDLVFSIH